MADYAKLQTICGKTYKEQAVWFLNCFWEEFASKEAELLWQYVLKNEELDLEFHKEGTGLDEMKAHVFLEKFDETLTVRDMRDKLRSTGAVARKALLEAQQAESSAKSREAEAKQREAEAKASEEQAKQREAAAKASAEEAKQREVQAQKDAEAAKVAELDAQAAQRELEAALAEVHAQEQAYNAKKADLEKKSEEGGVVSRNKAKAELAQHLAEDPLPLRKAKITQEAAVKRAEKATLAASDARTAAEAAANNASAAREKAEKAAVEATASRLAAEKTRQLSADPNARAEAALNEASVKFKEAEDYLEEVKSRPGSAHGAIWWIERELHEQKKYLPTAKGGIAK